MIEDTISFEDSVLDEIPTETVFDEPIPEISFHALFGASHPQTI